MMKLMRLISAILVVVMLTCACALADVVTTGNVNLRSGPGTNYSILATIPNGERLAYLGDNGSGTWYNVRYNDMDGWISAKYADVVENLLPGVIIPDEVPDEPEVTVYREVSVFWKQNLQSSAESIGLNGYQESLGNPPKKYFDSDLMIGGNENVEMMVLYGDNYYIFGVNVGTSVSAAAANLVKRGMFFSRNGEGSVFFTSRGYDPETASGSILELKIADGAVTGIEWKAAGL